MSESESLSYSFVPGCLIQWFCWTSERCYTYKYYSELIIKRKLPCTHLSQCDVGELFKGKFILLAAVSLLLSLQDTAGSHRGHAHAVPHEEDHILGVPVGGASGGQHVLKLTPGLGVPEVAV